MKPRDEIKLLKQPIDLIEPDQDYGLWENLYGRNLTEMEKLEIKMNLSDFFGILIHEQQRISKAQ